MQIFFCYECYVLIIAYKYESKDMQIFKNKYDITSMLLLNKVMSLNDVMRNKLNISEQSEAMTWDLIEFLELISK